MVEHSSTLFLLGMDDLQLKGFVSDAKHSAWKI